ncbi:MAG: AAA family ATPase [Eubacteriales bacterium]|nr:AAA family ATPase [Eubacteriales bacterium]
MGFYVNPPADGFAEVLADGQYVDKSGLIAYTNGVLGTSRKLIISTRPRRFGKSFAAKMLTAYYSKGADARSLFEKLKIASIGDEGRYDEHLNKHDVIFVDVTSFISRAEDIRNTVYDLQAAVIKELKKEYPGCISDHTKKLASALMDVREETGHKFLIIIDEWDALFREAKNEKELQESYIQFLRSLFKTAETSQIIAGAYMTGILPIKKYGTQSALTDFREFTMLEPGPLAPFIGFTEDEVKLLCEEYDLDFTETQKWYDGYQFDIVGQFAAAEKNQSNSKTGRIKIKQGNIVQHVYCPNSIVELMTKRKFGSYWTKTETYESLREYIDFNYDGLKNALVNMLGGKRCRIDPETFQNDMVSIRSRDDIFTLLVHLGYLAYDSDRKEVFIPNEEVRGEFIRAVKEGGRPELAKAVKISDDLLKATLAKDEMAVAKMIEAAHFAETAPQNYNDEQALRHVVIMAYLTSIDHYLKFEELASGREYCDILFLPRPTSRKPALLVELKWNKSADQAITQITDKQYPQIMKKFGYEGKLLLIGLNYSTKTGKHTCRIAEY